VTLRGRKHAFGDQPFSQFHAVLVEGEVTDDGRAEVFPGNDVVDLESPVVEFLRQLAVFAAAVCPFARRAG
jgi:hypothetical protein